MLARHPMVERARLRTWLSNALDDPRAARSIIAVGFAIRLLALAVVARFPLDGDGASYHETAQHLAHGDRYDPHWPPGLPLFLSLGLRVHDHELVSRLMMLIVYGVFCALILDIGKRLDGRRTANAALAVFAVTPIFIWSSVTPLTQLFSATTALGVVACAFRCRQGESVMRNAIILGVSLSFLMLTRPSNMGIALVVPLYLLWKTRRWQTVVMPILVMVIAIGAWSAKARAMTGRTVFVNDANSQNIYYGNNRWTPLYRTWWFGSRHRADGDEVPDGYQKDYDEIESLPLDQRDRAFMQKATDHIKDRPDLFVIRSLARIRTFAAFETFTSAQIARRSKVLGALTLALDAALYLLIIGLAILLPGARKTKPEPPAGSSELVRLLLLVSLSYALPYFVVFSHPTYHFTDVPLIGLLGAVAIARTLDHGFRGLWEALSRRGRIGIALGGVAFFLIQIEWAVDVLTRPTRG